MSLFLIKTIRDVAPLVRSFVDRCLPPAETRSMLRVEIADDIVLGLMLQTNKFFEAELTGARSRSLLEIVPLRGRWTLRILAALLNERSCQW
jgi:hypothetical protein